MSEESRAAFLVRSHYHARATGRDAGFTARLAESFADSLHSPQVVADLADLATAAIAQLAEANGVSFRDQLDQLDQPGIVRAVDVDQWIAPEARVVRKPLPPDPSIIGFGPHRPVAA